MIDNLHLEYLRASPDALCFGASTSKGKVTLWAADTLEEMATVRPGVVDSCWRHAIDCREQMIYFGTWDKGLTCFDLRERRVRWRCKDLVGIQAVGLGAGYSDSLFITVERRERDRGRTKPFFGIVELDRNTGETRWVEPNGQKAFVHPEKATLLICDGKTIRILDGNMQQLGQAEMVSFAILNAAFSGDRIALAEGAKGVRVIDAAGATICSYSPQGRKPNCIEVAFTADQLCIHDSWEGAFVTTIDPVSGRVIAEHQRPIAGDICFISDGSRYVDQTGAVFDALTGSQIGQLNPPKESRLQVGSWLRNWLKL